ncbi:hypothetical protein SZ66_20755 [Pantoea ananatis]|nr:hypothetical protein [Pantoea ananatis]
MLIRIRFAFGIHKIFLRDFLTAMGSIQINLYIFILRVNYELYCIYTYYYAPEKIIYSGSSDIEWLFNRQRRDAFETTQKKTLSGNDDQTKRR